MKQGPYDLLLTDALQSSIDSLGSITESLQSNPEALTEYLLDLLSRKVMDLLEDSAGETNESKVQSQIAFANSLIKEVEKISGDRTNTDRVNERAAVLRWIGNPNTQPSFPQTGLTHSWLFTAGKASPALLNELRAEMTTCSQLDMLVSFITVSGVRKIRDILESITATDAEGKTTTKIRILTTTYMGATEKKALDELATLPGCEVRISLDGRRTRLHAKAWIFHRETGFGTAYVGSANLSAAAMTGGLEWTVKFSQRAQARLFNLACANFETLWEDNEFQCYDPSNIKHANALASALKAERGGGSDSSLMSYLEVTAKPFQQDILEQLAFERQHERTRNLLVAATGTGKTVMAALDYRRHALEVGGKPRLLFVAHRIEILKQARYVFRQVLGDTQFGELLDGNHAPLNNDHLFASIFTVNARQLVEQLSPGYWSMVIIDECHHITADSFSKFARSIKPKILLGLTATPERADGNSILPFFDSRPDGSPAAELRLWHAMNLQLLSPFEYFGCDDDTDLSKVRWNTASETEDLAKIIDGNEIRARAMLREWQRLTTDPRHCKTLIFCVSKSHAEFIADFLSRHGVPTVAVHSEVNDQTRVNAPIELKQGNLSAITAVDLFNEGIDLPFIDTLILLRPTQSPVVFQQQIGRGLRLHPGKDACLVLDFVGQHSKDFRFDRLLSGITGLNRIELKEGLEAGFPSLPSGCHLFLQKQSRTQVLSQLQALVNQRWSVLIRELRVLASLNRQQVSLGLFLRNFDLSLSDVYRKSGNSGWLNLLFDAGLQQIPLTVLESRTSKKLVQILHFDDPVRIDGLKKLISGDEHSQREWAKTLYFLIEGRTPDHTLPSKWLSEILASERSREELNSVRILLESKCRLLHRPVPGLENTRLCLHASYTPLEIGIAVGWFTETRNAPITAGVLALNEIKTELFFVTLDKSEGFHENIAYQDCAISQTIFKWQTQNSVKPNSPVGRRYLESSANGWQFQLFVRVKKGDPFRALGPVKLKSAEGSGPMTIYWNLVCPMGAALFREFNAIGDA